MAPTLFAERIGSRSDELGEGPAWDERRQRLLWADIVSHQVNELVYDGESGWQDGRSFDVGEAVSAVVPTESGELLVTAGGRILILSDEGELSTFAELDPMPAPNARFNDAKCDPRGRLLAGWMSEEEDRVWGRLCRVDPDGSVETVLDGVGLSNGLDWSPDGETFYFVDTLRLTVDAFDYDLDRGTLSNRRTAVGVRGEGSPDGMTVDDEGCLWVALLFGGVHRYSPAGELISSVETPSRQTTSCAFGGPERDELFITSLSIDIPASLNEATAIPDAAVETAARDQHKGELFRCLPGVSGPPARPFGL
jgi:sugar lactone lactonase YvrE